MKTIAFLFGFVAGALLVGDGSPVNEGVRDGVDFMISALEAEARLVVDDIDQ